MPEHKGFAFATAGTDTHEREAFIAAALTIGFRLADNTPGYSNVYSSGRKYERGQPGDIRYYLATTRGALYLQDFVRVWRERDPALQEAEALPGLILTADNGQALQYLIEQFDRLYLRAAVATMRQFSLRRIAVPDIHGSDPAEARALETLDDFAAQTSAANMGSAPARKARAKLLCQHWRPAMHAWVKAWHSNYGELRNLWREAPEAIKIDRPGRMPLVIPRGPQFREMLERWT